MFTSIIHPPSVNDVVLFGQFGLFTASPSVPCQSIIQPFPPLLQISHPPGDSVANPSFATNMYESANANNALSRFGIGDNRMTYVNSANNDYGGAPSGINNYQPQQQPYNQQQQQQPSMAFGQITDFKDFHDIPASSMLLTNYDPFYSPLLSRLDAVFQQMSLPAGDEKCREKLICLMYASPAKYAPYSNLVSAQLSR